MSKEKKLQDLSSRSLVLRCINRERLAWDKFVERFSQLIYWAIKERLNRTNYHYNQQDLEDIFQNVFVLLYEKGKLRQIKNKESISTWLVIVAANCTVNYFRNKNKDFIQDEPALEKARLSDCDTSETIVQERLHQTLEATIDFLPARERIILKLSYLHNRTHEEIGKILKMPANTVSSIVKRSKEKLKEELKRQDWEKF